jgi:hypothetical protein
MVPSEENRLVDTETTPEVALLRVIETNASSPVSERMPPRESRNVTTTLAATPAVATVRSPLTVLWLAVGLPAPATRVHVAMELPRWISSEYDPRMDTEEKDMR